MAILAAHHDDSTGMADLELIIEAEAAPKLARPFGIGGKGVATHAHWRLRLQDLDRHVAQEGDADIGAGDAVLSGRAARSAGDRVGDDDPSGGAKFGSRDIADDDRAGAADRDAARHRLVERAEDEVMDAHRRSETHAA